MTAHIDDAANGGSEPGAWLRAMNPNAPLPATPHDFLARASLAMLRPIEAAQVPAGALDAARAGEGVSPRAPSPAPGVVGQCHAGRLFDPSSHEVRNG